MKVTIRQWANAQKQLGPKFRDALRRGMALAGQRAIFELQRETEAKKVFDTGGFKRGWRFSTPEDYVLRLYNQQPYSAVIEYGRRPGATPPPASALVSWVKRKLKVKDDTAARHAAFNVAINIGIKGIPGKFVMRDARPRLAKIIREEVEREVTRSLSLGGR